MAAVFGVRQFGQSKKTITVSVTELGEEENNNDQQEKTVDEQAEVADQSATVENTQEKKIEDAHPAADSTIKQDVPVAKEEQQPVTEDKKVSTVGKIVQRLISWGFTKSSDRKIDTIIVHSSYDALGSDPYSVSGIIAEYKQYEVSAHYLIARDGTIYQLVADQNIAWHAGVSQMPDGRKNVNDFSIGVEMINTQDGKYTDDQYSALNSLIATLKKKYSIEDILGHNEIAPGRKTDPWGIDWKKVNR